MSRRIALSVFLFLALVLAIPMACQKSYSIAPLPGPTPTPTCVAIPQTTPIASGINWGEALVGSGTSWGSTFISASLYMTVNGAVETTDGVTFTGTGISPIALKYQGPYTITGTAYAWYYYQGTSPMTGGGTYTLTSVTSIGTAWATLPLPNDPTISPDGLTATWSGPSMFNVVAVVPSAGGLTYESSLCWSASSPFSIPNSAYPSPGNYGPIVERLNYTTSITGGTGYMRIFNDSQIIVTK